MPWATTASARLWIVAVPICAKLSQRNSSRSRDLLVHHRAHRFRRDIAPGHAGAAGSDHHVDAGIGGQARKAVTMASASSSTSLRATSL